MVEGAMFFEVAMVEWLKLEWLELQVTEFAVVEVAIVEVTVVKSQWLKLQVVEAATVEVAMVEFAMVEPSVPAIPIVVRLLSARNTRIDARSCGTIGWCSSSGKINGWMEFHPFVNLVKHKLSHRASSQNHEFSVARRLARKKTQKP